jgi:hypothetical protein
MRPFPRKRVKCQTAFGFTLHLRNKKDPRSQRHCLGFCRPDVSLRPPLLPFTLSAHQIEAIFEE